MITSGDGYGCGQCGVVEVLCENCHNCEEHCHCPVGIFDADELGLDPETNNTPKAEDRHA